MKIDDFDLALLDLLKGQGRAPIIALADQLQVSRHKVMYRMRRLEKAGVIHSYACLVDFETLTQGFYAMVRLKIRPNLVAQVIPRLLAFPETYGIYHLTGEFNLQVFGLFGTA